MEQQGIAGVGIQNQRPKTNTGASGVEVEQVGRLLPRMGPADTNPNPLGTESILLEGNLDSNLGQAGMSRVNVTRPKKSSQNTNAQRPKKHVPEFPHMNRGAK